MKNTLRFLLFLLLLLATRALRLVAQPSPAVASYTLVNADTDLDIQSLPSGAVLDLATLPTRNLNIRANPSPGTVGSVVFGLSGAATQATTENVVPYALFSNLNGDYFAWTPPVGAYGLTATPYAGPDGTGAAGGPLAISFTVINSVGSVGSYTLVDADTDLDIQPLPSGAVLDLAALPTRHLNIRANPSQVTVGSVVFNLSGAATQATTENVVPYALFSDVSGAYEAWTPPVGAYALTATPYGAVAGVGPVGIGLTITFVVIDSQLPLPVELTTFSASLLGSETVALRWATASEQHCRTFIIERSPDGQQFAAVGAVAGHGSTALAQAYRYDDNLALAGPAPLYYRLRQVDDDGSSYFSPVRSVVVAGQAAAFVVFPTLADGGRVHYAFAGPATGAEVLEVLTLLGQSQARCVLATSGLGTVDLAGLPPGAYLLRLTSAQGRYTARFVLP